jgi:tetratricopeptide (TPR) repeat protein
VAGIQNIIGNYRLLEELASGAFGRVYRAEHTILTTRIVAIKLMHGVHLNSQKERESFIQEALLLEKLKHPHILPIIDVGIHEGFPYLVTEFASHGSLRQRLQRQPQIPLSQAEALTILSHIAQALHHAHQQHVIHRDLKPENILFNANNEALLADFGIATVMSTLSLQQATISGTPAYMAPEQFQGKVSQESDQYALACIAYELFTGKQPFQAPDFISMGFKHLMEQPTALTLLNPQIPRYIEQAILTSMAKDRANRHTDVRVFLTALQAPEKSPQQWVDKGNKLYSLKRYEEAITAYDQAIRINPNDATTYNNKGISLHGLRRYEEAITTYDQAIHLDSNNTFAYNNKGISLHALRRYEEAITTYDQAIHLDSNNAFAYYNKGKSLDNLRQYKEAITAYDQAIRLDPNYASAYYNKGNSLDNLKRYEEAITAYDQAIRLNPNDAFAYYNKGISLDNLKRYEEAITTYDQAIHLDSNNTFAYNNKGISLHGLRRYEEAITAYDQAIHLDPNDAFAYNNKGISLHGLRRYEEAITAYDQAIHLDPNYTTAYNNKGLALQQLGKNKEAQQAYKRAKQLGYSS